MTISPLLSRQLQELGLSAGQPPSDPAGWAALLAVVSDFYDHADSLVRSSLDPLFSVAPDGKILFVSRPFLGKEPGDLVGQSFFSLFEARSYRARRAVQFAFSGLNDQSENVICKDAAGQPRYLSIRSGPLMRGNEVSAALVCAMDMTEQRNLKELADSSQALLAHSSKMISLGEMAGGIAHEVNTPLATLKLLAEQVSDLTQEPAPDLALIASHSAKIANVVVRIADTIRGLRAFARDGERDPFELVGIRELVSDTLAFCRERFAAENVRLEVEEAPAGLLCMGRAVQLSQVLLNLLNNAFDAVADAPEKWVHMGVSEQASTFSISVTDSGPGVPGKICEKIFQPFFTTKPVGQGTGMGLSISRSLIEEHGGTIILDPLSPNTRFVVKLTKADPKARP